MKKIYAQYGCGFSVAGSWRNFDASPTLRLERLPIIGGLIKKNKTPFPDGVEYGDIVKGLPIADNYCDGIYASHVLEHLSLQDFQTALRNTYKILKPGGIFRLIVPDLKMAAQQYISSSDPKASHEFLRVTSLGLKERPKGIPSLITSYFGNSAHLWMWDYESLCVELKKAGYVNLRQCEYNDCDDKLFLEVEDVTRFENSVAIECKK